MADVKKFKFVSPGIFISEVDNSQIPRLPDDMGPVIIGLAERGPNMRPVQIDSFSEFVETFGYPMPGNGTDDAWRDGNYSAATHGAYAAQAYLKNSSPVTFVKLAGSDHAETSAGPAGWKVGPAAAALSTGNAEGAFGLFVAPSNSAGTGSTINFVHAATFYVERGAIALEGALYADGTEPTDNGGAGSSGVNVVVQSTVGPAGGFTLRHYGNETTAGAEATMVGGVHSGKQTDKIFNFNEDSENFIRKVFSTDPVSTGTLVDPNSTTYEDFWLGQSYEDAVEVKLGTAFSSGVAGASLAVLMPLAGNSKNAGDWEMSYKTAATGWVFSQNQGTPTQLNTALGTVLAGSSSLPVVNLFKIHSLYGGEWEQSNLKISIKDVKKSSNQFNKYGTFTVQVRRASDSDKSPVVLESFSNCNLNPKSPNYIASKIGDKFTEWDSLERRYKEYNNHANMSRFIRIEMNKDVDTGQIEPSLLPFGFYGPVKFVTETKLSGVALDSVQMASPELAALAFSGSLVATGSAGSFIMGHGSASAHNYSGSFEYPSLKTRVSTEGFADPTKAYFGVDTTRSSSSAFDDSYVDLVRALPNSLDTHVAVSSSGLVYSFIFTLDDVALSGTDTTGYTATHAAGKQADESAYTAQAGNTYDSLLTKDYNKFTIPLFGGFNGLDVTKKNPFSNTVLAASANEKTNYAYNSVKQAIDSAADPEVVECNLMSVPGVWCPGLTSHLIDVCEERADALAIIDIENDFQDASENYASENDDSRKANVTTAVSQLRGRALNSSYGAAYFPWCTIRDNNNGSLVSVPPSVIAMGVLSYSQTSSELWFAPAGFTRGGLSENRAAGLPVIGVKYALSSKDRDKLYEANINPIATFPNEGIVVFGQKTLQVTQSALDRINVRRLMIYLKKEISRMSATLLFDQNVQATWDRFLSKVDPFLSSVKSRFGLTEYRVILDETTTTSELIDRNIMYAKIFLKPARAIEFIALDFVITDSGASFEDL